MVLRLTFLTTLVLFLISSCTNEDITENAASYNDSIVGIFEPVQESYTNLVDGIYGSENADLDQLLTTFRTRSENAKETMDKMPVFGNDTAFYRASVRLADFYFEAARKEYQEIVEIVKKDNTSVEEELFLENFMMGTLEKEEERFNDFAQAQEKFAKTNNVRLIYPEDPEN